MRGKILYGEAVEYLNICHGMKLAVILNGYDEGKGGAILISYDEGRGVTTVDWLCMEVNADT